MISIKGKVQKIGLLTGADSEQPYLHQFLTYLLRFFCILFPMIKECFSGHLDMRSWCWMVCNIQSLTLHVIIYGILLPILLCMLDMHVGAGTCLRYWKNMPHNAGRHQGRFPNVSKSVYAYSIVNESIANSAMHAGYACRCQNLPEVLKLAWGARETCHTMPEAIRTYSPMRPRVYMLIPL